MPREIELKAVYTVTELARMGNVTTREMRRLLRDAQIPIHRTGRTGRVKLDDLRRCDPALWASVQLVTRVRNAGASAEVTPRQ